MLDRQTLANLIPLVAVLVSGSEYFFDHHEPRYTSPTFWLAMIVVVGMLIGLQLLRMSTGRPARMAKPDYSATTLIRRRAAGDEDDRG
jgi:hypothetical protein